MGRNGTGYFGVHLDKPGRPKPYTAELRRGGKPVCLGRFATAEEAALCVARSPEGQAVAMQPHGVSSDGCYDDACEEVVVLDAVEVDAWADDSDEIDYQVLVSKAAVGAGAPSLQHEELSSAYEGQRNLLLNRGMLEGLGLADSALSRGRKAKQGSGEEGARLEAPGEPRVRS